MVRGPWSITSQHFKFSYRHERGAWSITSQHFQIRYRGYREFWTMEVMKMTPQGIYSIKIFVSLLSRNSGQF